MSAVIYGVFPSPPTRSALWTAKLVGLEHTLEKLDMFKGEHKSEKYLKINPAHTIPAFVGEDGFSVFESHSIVTYIVDKYAKDDSLYPKDLKKRALVNSMLHFDNGSFWPAVNEYGRSKMFGTPLSPEKEAAFKDKLTTLNTFLGLRPYAAGEKVTVADLCLITSLSALKALGSEEELKLAGEYPHVGKWAAKLKAEVKFYDEIVVQGAQALGEMAKQMVAAQKAAK